MRRYASDGRLDMGRMYGSPNATRKIRQMVDNGAVPVELVTLRSSERLDVIAGKRYGDARLWWVIAAASGIGWGLQVPAGTVLTVPTDLGMLEQFVG